MHTAYRFRRLKAIFSIFIITYFIPRLAQAYPDFIGFSYRSCLVCHYSGAGGGALTDYGRGVFAGEIADNPFRSKVNDEEIVDYANFLGKSELPWWTRLGIKYRNLSLQTSPGSSATTNKYYRMQQDLNANFFFKKDQSVGLITTLGYTFEPNMIAPNKTTSSDSNLFWREYFFRYQLSKEYWAYLGFMDKVFGIRQPDHTSVNRSPIGLGQNDQVHGLQAQWAGKDHDLFLHYWIGNAHLGQERTPGFSVMFEKKWGQSHAYGLGFLSESSDTMKQQILEVHNKMGFGEGNAFLMEMGFLNKTKNGDNTHPMYVFTQGDMRIRRGLYLVSGGEYSKDDIQKSTAEITSWKMGFLWFPMQRLEVRVNGVNKKVFNASIMENDQWSVQSQLHISL